MSRLALLLGAATLLFSAWAQNQATLTPIGKWPEYPLLATPLAMKVVPPYAYLAGLASPPAAGQPTATLRLLTLDVSTPSQPRYLGHVDAADGLGWSYTSIQVQGGLAACVEGNYAYLRNRGIRILDVANPRAPSLVGGTDDIGGELFDPCTSVGASDFRIVGARAYVAGSTSYVMAGSVDIGFLQVLGLSNPAQPSELGYLDLRELNGGMNIDVAGGRAYLTSVRTGFGGVIENDFRLTVIDVSDPPAMSELGHLALTDFAGPVQVVGDLAYYRLYDTDLVAVDIRDPGQMVEVGRYHPANPFCGFQVVERYAFALPPTDAAFFRLIQP